MDASNVVVGEAPPKTSSPIQAKPRRAVAEKPDAMGFELALQLQDLQSAGFDAAVMAAVDSVGGELLFDMPLPMEADCQHVAAVSLGTGEDRALVLVMQPKDSDALRVETIEESRHPLAGIVAAYAGLMDRLSAAA